MTHKLKNKVAIITGGSSGIGQATAIALYKAGAKVAIVGRNTLRINNALDFIRKQIEVSVTTESLLGLTLDVRKESDMNEMVLQVMENFGRIDILVASAGSGGSLATARRLPYAVVQLPTEEWDEIIDTNLKGIFLSNRAVLPIMMKQMEGDIINVSSSRGATYGLPYAAAYSASKHGVMGLSEALSEEVHAYGIRVQVILPDVTDTPMLHATESLAPQGLLKTEMVADIIFRMLTLPGDTVMEYPLIEPFAVMQHDI
jgi:Short-chain alcohol dehydrogenase of unknown specificity